MEIVCGSDSYYERLDRRDYYAPREPAPEIEFIQVVDCEPPDDPNELIEEEVVELISRIESDCMWGEVLSIYNGVIFALYDSRNPAPHEMQTRLRAELDRAVMKFRSTLGK